MANDQGIAYYSDRKVNVVSLEGRQVGSFSLNVPIKPPPADPPVYLKGGIIVPLGDVSFISAADIVIESHRISQVKSVSSGQPVSASGLDLSGKYLIPGLVDTHVHSIELDPRGFIAYGVTTIRDAGGPVLRLQQLQELIESGQVVGPRLFFCGPAFDGPSAFDEYAAGLDGMDIHNEAEAVGRVQRVRRGGADYIKLYEHLTRGAKRAAIRAAAAEGLNVIGHAERMPAFTTHFLEGVGTIEHGLDSRFYDDFRQFIIQIGTFYDATMMAIAGDQWYVDCHPEVLNNPHFLSLAPADLIQGYLRRAARENFTREALESHIRDKAEPLYDLALSRQIVAGTDAKVTFPGIGLHWEMEAMVLGGLSPQQALQAATIDAAYCMGIDKDLGSIEEKKLADIVVLNRNPLVDISATKDIALIIKNGKCYSPVDGSSLSLEEARELLKRETKN
jgi:imidazolonepropionase-like amidohydrolase